MAPESVDVLLSWIDHKDHRRDLALQRVLILKAGASVSPKAHEELIRLLKHHQAPIQAAAAEALANYASSDLELRKEAFEGLLQLMMDVKGAEGLRPARHDRPRSLGRHRRTDHHQHAEALRARRARPAGVADLVEQEQEGGLGHVSGARRRSLWAVSGLLAAALAVLAGRVLEPRAGGQRQTLPPRASNPRSPVPAFDGRLEGSGGGVLVARLTPLHADPARQAFEARVLAERLELDAGEPWRLSLAFEAGALADPLAELDVGALRVDDERGTALAPIAAEPGSSTGAADPLRALLAPPRGGLASGEQVDQVLWGRAPLPGAVLVGIPAAGFGSSERLELAPTTVERRELAEPLARLADAGSGAAPAPAPAGRAVEQARCAELERQVAALEGELARAQEERLAREREWLAFTRALSALELEALDDTVAFAVDAGLAQAEPEASSEPEGEAAPASAPPAPDAQALRAAEIHRSLSALLAVDGLRGMDLLESGLLGDGCVGPVVFRLVDADGRLSGSLVAERLRLEASQAARTVTLVLEGGRETWRGEATEFERPGPDPRASGVRRVLLPRVDPRPWFEALPELFAANELDQPIDDGIWSATLVRGTLNELLRDDAAGGYYRLKELGGVRDDVLRAVHLEGYGADGKLERRLFADRLRIMPQEQGMLLQLEDGAQMRGAEKAAFLDGRYRIFLPRADRVEWAARGIPGVSE